jgi:hypothetical protein
MANKHSLQTIRDGIHVPISYEFADAVARGDNGSYLASDVGKFARQLDNNTLWWLSAVTNPGSSATPTWSPLGGGGDVYLNSPNIFTKRQAVTPITLTYASTVTINLASSNSFILTLTGNVTLAFSNIVAGTSGWIDLIQDGTGSRTLTLPASCKRPGGAALTLTTTANAKDKLFYSSSDGTTLDVVLNKDFR